MCMCVHASVSAAMPTARLEQVAKVTHRGGVEVAHRRRATASRGSALILQVKVKDEAVGGGACCVLSCQG